MTPVLLQRLLGLAAFALIAGLVAVAIVREDGSEWRHGAGAGGLARR